VKFWELVSVCRGEPQLLERLADKPEWTVYLEWYRNEDKIVDMQDRSKLDAEMPDEACLHVLSASKTRYYLSGGYLRSRRFSPSDTVLSAVDAFKAYGGRSLEDAQEYGSVKISGDYYCSISP
jgi:hypothetical protein